MITTITGHCQYEECTEPATHIAYGGVRHPLGVYCEPHAESVQHEDDPEYGVECPNCDCRFGVN
jgi:hypothetical protein